MQKIVSSQTVQKWATDYIDELLSLKKQNERNKTKLITDVNKQIIVSEYKRSHKD
jgi:trehalose 6-phosphate synthase/phosphatase